MTKFAPHLALKSIASGKLTLNQRVVLHRVRGVSFGGASRPGKVDIRLPGKGNSTSHGARPVC